MRSVRRDRKSSHVARSTDGRARGIPFFILNFNLRFFSSAATFHLDSHARATLNQFSLRSSCPRKSDPVKPARLSLFLYDLISNIGFGIRLDSRPPTLVIRRSLVISELILEAKRENVATRDRVRAAHITDVISSA